MRKHNEQQRRRQTREPRTRAPRRARNEQQRGNRFTEHRRVHAVRSRRPRARGRNARAPLKGWVLQAFAFEAHPPERCGALDRSHHAVHHVAREPVGTNVELLKPRGRHPRQKVFDIVFHNSVVAQREDAETAVGRDDRSAQGRKAVANRVVVEIELLHRPVADSRGKMRHSLLVHVVELEVEATEPQRVQSIAERTELGLTPKATAREVQVAQRRKRREGSKPRRRNVEPVKLERLKAGRSRRSSRKKSICVGRAPAVAAQPKPPKQRQLRTREHRHNVRNHRRFKATPRKAQRLDAGKRRRRQ
eukprot:Amastigsp_a339731_29.p2 type:complete len:305 gc:universal Amastigsp_a339731_29:452-1366(+)